MALYAHRELIKCTSNRLHGLKVTVLAITLNQGIFAAIDAVGRRIENHRASASKALSVQRAGAFFATDMTGFARY